MAKIFDDTSRFLTSFDTLSWAKFLGMETDKAELCNADLSTVASQADAIILLGEDKRRAAHVEIQASADPKIDIRILFYYVLGIKTLGIPIRSFLVLLRPEADRPPISGTVRHVDEKDNSSILEFRYTVIRVWQISAEKLIESGLGVMPLAFIADIEPAKLPGLVKRAEERLEREAEPGKIGDFWTSIDILMGLRYEREVVAELLKGVRAMKESVTYQAILEEGQARGAAKEAVRARLETLLRLGAYRFGPPDSKIRADLEATQSTDRLDDLIDRSLIVSSWNDLLA